MSEKKPDDLLKAREFLHRVSKELNIGTDAIDQATPYLLGLTKHVAHDVVRPAAPLAAFLAGFAAAGSTEKVTENIAAIESLVKEYQLGQA